MSNPTDQPQCGGIKPAVLELEPGTYYWCTCGRSKTQPFCDDSHLGTHFQPKEVVITEKKRISLCTCKLTKNPPMCDGSHKSLPPETQQQFQQREQQNP